MPDVPDVTIIIFILSIGNPVNDESGELVCVAPFPSMPTHFWNDPDGIKYQKAYFTMFQGNSLNYD